LRKSTRPDKTKRLTERIALGTINNGKGGISLERDNEKGNGSWYSVKDNPLLAETGNAHGEDKKE